MNTAVTNTAERKAAMQTVGAALEKMKPQLQAVLPKHITPERLARVALVAIQNTPKLLECDRQSLYLAILRSAQLGLEPDGILGQAYLIPYGKQVQFIPGYRGLIDLARRSGEVSNIIAKEVYENDEFVVDYSQDVPFSHKPLLKGERGEVTHFWAMARFKDGGFHWDYMTAEEVTAVRDQSSGWQAAKKWGKAAESPWQKHFIEMGKKTVIRRIAKYLPMSVQRAAAFEAMQDAGHKVNFQDGDLVIEENVNPETGEVIEGEATVTGAAAKLEQFADEKQPETTEDLSAPLSPADMPESTGAELEKKGKELLRRIQAGGDKKLDLMAEFGGDAFLGKLGDAGKGMLLSKIRAA